MALSRQMRLCRLAIAVGGSTGGCFPLLCAHVIMCEESFVIAVPDCLEHAACTVVRF